MSVANLAQEAPKKADNFLIPNGTFIVETIIILIVLFIFFRFIVPPVRKAMQERNELVQKGFDESRAAEEKFRQAEERYQQSLAEARNEAARIRDTSRVEGQKILDEFRARTNSEVAELRQQAADTLTEQRERVLGELEPKVLELATGLASRVVGDEVAAPKGGRS